MWAEPAGMERALLGRRFEKSGNDPGTKQKFYQIPRQIEDELEWQCVSEKVGGHSLQEWVKAGEGGMKVSSENKGKAAFTSWVREGYKHNSEGGVLVFHLW